MQDKIRAALQQYDPEDDEQWTSDGLPKMGVIQAMPGMEAVTRRNVTEAAPEFCRDALRQARQAPPQEPAEHPADTTTPMLAQEPSQAAPAALEDDLEGVRASYQALQDRVAEFDKHIEHLRVGRQAVVDERDALAKVLDRTPAVPFHQAVKDYQAVQLALRQERVEGVKRLTALASQAGAPGSTVQAPRAPIDQAMQRKNTRGAGRPQYPRSF